MSNLHAQLDAQTQLVPIQSSIVAPGLYNVDIAILALQDELQGSIWQLDVHWEVYQNDVLISADSVLGYDAGGICCIDGLYVAQTEVEVVSSSYTMVKAWVSNLNGFANNDFNLSNDTAYTHFFSTEPAGGRSALFNRVGYSRLQVPGSESIQLTNTFTFEAWVQPIPDDSLRFTIICKEGEFQIGRNNCQFQFSVNNTSDAWNWIPTNYCAQTGKWHHLALVYDNGTAVFYVNGIERGKHIYTGELIDEVPSFNELWIGGRENNALRSFAGYIDEVRWWTVARTPSQIRNWMTERVGLEDEADLFAVWSLGEASGSTATYEPISGLTAFPANGAEIGLSGAPIPDGPLAGIDIRLAQIVGINTNSILPEGTISPSIVVRNEGSSAVNEVEVSWIYDGQSNSQTLIELLGFGEETTIAPGGVPFPAGQVHSFTAWTSLPGDQNSANDTLTVEPFFADPVEPHQAIRLGTPGGINAGGSIAVNALPGLPTGSSARTVEFWVKPGNQSDFLIGYGGTQTTSDRFYVSRLGAGQVSVYYGNNASFELISTEVIAEGQWSHVAITYENSLLTIYINGNTAGQESASLETQNSIFCIGRVPIATIPSQWFDGSMDEVRVWSEARTPEQIREWMVKSAGIELQPGLVAAWSFTEPDGSSSTFDRIANIEGVLAGTYSFTTSAAPVSDNAVQTDLAVLAVLGPHSGCDNGNAESVITTVRNFGAIPVSSFILGFILNDTLIHTEQVDTLIAPGNTLDLTLSQTIDLSTSSTSTLAITVSIAGDQNQQNDTLISVIQSYPPILVSLEDDLSICQGDSVTLHAAGGSGYLWNDGSSGPNKIIAPDVTADYTVSVTGANGCLDSASVMVTVLPLPSQPVITPSATTLCPGDTVQLSTVSDPVEWSTGSTSAVIMVTTAGVYHIDAIDMGTGCRSRSVPVPINNSPVLGILPLGPTAVCEGDELELVALNAGSINWSFTPSVSDTVSYVAIAVGPDTVLLTGMSSGGCTSDASIVIEIVPSVPLDLVSEMLPFNGAQHIPVSTVFSFQPIPNASNYRVQYWPTGTEDTLTINTTASNNSVNGLLAITNYEWRVVALNSCQTSSSTVRTFITSGRIDLVVDTLIAPTQTTAGFTIPVTYSVGNHGTGPTGYQSWHDRVYLSTDNDLRIGDDLLLFSVPNLTYLDSSQVYLRTVNVTIPQTLSGTYYLFVITDNEDAYCWTPQQCADGPYGSHDFGLPELDENNNFRYTLVSFAIPPAPDLICTSVGSQTDINSNVDLPVIYGLANIGNLVILNKTIRNVLYLSSDSIAFEPVNLFPSITFGSSTGTFVAPNVRGLWHDVHIDMLAPGDTMYVPVSLPPPSTLDGEFYMFVWVDRKDSVFEAAGEYNNFLMRNGPVNVLPVVCDIEGELAGPTGTYPNDTLLVVPYTYFNNLDLAPPGNAFKNKLYLSVDDILDTDVDQLIASQSRSDGLNLLDSTGYVGSGEFSWSVPANLIGPHYLIAFFDADDDFYEDVNDNNIKTRALDFTLRVNTPLAVNSIMVSNSTPLSGEVVNLTVEIHNAGPDDLDRSIQLGIYHSASATFDPTQQPLDTSVAFDAGSIQAGQTVVTQVPVTIPDGYSGPLYYHSFIDQANVLFELNEGDNASSVAVNVGLADYPDLRVVGVDVTPPVSPTADLNVSYWVRNDGSATASVSRVDRFVLSVNAILGDIGDRDMGTRPFPTTIAPGDSAQFMATLDIPFDFAPVGAHNLFVIADAADAMYEHNGVQQADDNNASAPTIVTVLPSWTDVAVTGFTTSTSIDTVYSGTAMSATLEVTNLGPNTASNTIRIDRVYLSVDSSASSTSYNTSSVPNQLDPGESYTKNFSIQIPNGLSGPHVLAVNTDVGGTCVNDSVPENNWDYKPVFVRLTPPCDLQVTAVQVQPSAPLYMGQGVQVDYTVRNVLPDSAQANWTDKLYINSAPTLFGALALAQTTHTGGLPGNDEYAGTFNVALPGAMSGSRYLIVAADAYNNQYEHQAENNNDSIVPVFLNVPLPTDLVVSFVGGPSQWLLGQTDAVTLRVRNAGANVAVGLLGNNVFFSQDQSLNTLIDPLFATIQQPVFIAPGDSAEFTITKRLQDVDPGLYHYLGQTNAQANIYETNFLNNTSASIGQVDIDVEEIALGGSATTTLNNGDMRYYKVYVPEPGLDLLVTLDSDQEFGHNQVYHAYGRVPSVTDYDHAQEYETATDQQVLIPSADTGWHYLLVTTNVEFPIGQNATITILGLPFSIVSIMPNTVGPGIVTTCISGAGFDPSMSVFLVDANALVVDTATITSFTNSMQFYATWDLTMGEAGDYTVRVVNTTDTTNLLNGLQIEPIIVANLDLSELSPSSFRMGQSGIIDIHVQNTGNVDIDIARISVFVPAELICSVLEVSGAHDIPYLPADWISSTPGGVVKKLTFLVDHFIPGGDASIRISLSNFNSGVASVFVIAEPLSYGDFIESALASYEGIRQMSLVDDGVLPESWNDVIQNAEVYYADSITASLNRLGVFSISSSSTSINSSDTGMRNSDCAYGNVEYVISTYHGQIVVSVEYPPCLPDESDNPPPPPPNAPVFPCGSYVPILSEANAICALGAMVNYLYCTMGRHVVCATLDEVVEELPFVDEIPIVDYVIGEGCGLATEKYCNDLLNDQLNICKAVLTSCDPNEVIGPIGSGSERFVAKSIEQSFEIHYENDSTLASTSARNVLITQKVDEDFDIYSVRLGSFSIDDAHYTVPSNSMSYSLQFMLNGVLVSLAAGVDVPNREVYWSFESLNAQTLLPPDDPSAGFLPINDSLGSGQGFVSFRMLPAIDAETRDTLSVQAEITFDINEPILTNIWTNLLDAEGPISQVDSLVSVNDSTVVVYYSANDPNEGSGVESVDVYVSVGGGQLELVASALHPDSSYAFIGTPGLEYCFASVARDTVRYVEQLPAQPDQCITLVPQAFSLVGPATGSAWCLGSSLTIAWGSGGISTFDLSFSDDAGGEFTPIATSVSGPSYMWTVPLGAVPSGQYVIRITDSGDPATYVESGLFTIQALPAAPSVTANGPVEFCAGDLVQLSGPSGFSSYQWLPSGSNGPSTTVTTNGTYSLSVTDSNGCTSEPSIGIIVVIHALPAAPSISPSPAEFCEGDSLLLMAASGYDQYSWSTGASTQSIWVDATTSVQLTGTDAFGCVSPSNSASAVEWPLPGTPQIVVQGGDTLCSDLVAQSYLWTYEGNPVGTEQCQPMSWAGVYRLYVSNGPCQDSAIFIITDVNYLQSPSSEIMVIPNPNQGTFDLLLSEAFDQEVSLQITSSSGQVVHRELIKAVLKSSRKIPIDLRKEADGVYDVLLTSRNASQMVRVLIRK